ncbi:MAG: transglycosylase SLT domain-containing protein [Prevotella sp.]
MKRLVKKACLSLSILTLMPLQAGAANGNDNSEQFDWSPVMEAIILVESEGNPSVVSGNSVGAMQITPIVVRECNNILKSRGSDKRYQMSDRYDVEKSKEMFLLIQSQYNKSNNVEKAIRSWNGGPNYSIRATNRYYEKVLRRMK